MNGLCGLLKCRKTATLPTSKSRYSEQSTPPKSTTSPSKMDADDSYPLDRPPPQQSGSVKKTARMSTSSSAQSDDTAFGAASLNQPAQQPHRTVVDAKQAPEHAGVSATSTQIIMPVRGGPPTASIQTQSNQVAGDILESDVYLSARKLLAVDRNSGKDSSLNASGALDATVAHSHFAELLDCLKSQISAGGHDDLLSDVMLPGLVHLVSLIEQTRYTASKATNLPTASTAPSAGTTTLAFRAHPAKSSAASPSSVSAATSTPEDTATTPTVSLETTTLALRSYPINPSAFPTPVLTSTAQPFQFPSLPHDVKVRILSFVPETDVALNCRLVCREFRDLINGNELQIAQLVAEREHSKLQSQIDMRRQIMPTSLTDFVFDAGLWVQWRGFCPANSDITLDSFTAWRLSPNRHQDMFSQGIQVQPHNLVMWGILTDNLLRLQLDL